MDIENLINDLDELVVIARRGENIGVSKWLSLNSSVAVVKELLEKQLRDKWIPVSERLPNEEELKKFKGLHPNRGKFICTIQVLDLEPQVRSIYYDRLLGWLYEGENYNEYVIAWQPLPEPYKEVLE